VQRNGNLHDSTTVVMDLNRASIVAQREAEAAAIKEQAKRIVDNSVTRLDPVMKDFTSASIGQVKNETKQNKDQ
jgi:hypothetical protein